MQSQRSPVIPMRNWIGSLLGNQSARFILPILLTWSVMACDGGSSARKVEDVSIVNAYFMKCDSAVSYGDCAGPAHQASIFPHTVIVSRQLVIPPGVFLYHDCLVRSPDDWYCFDSQNEAVWMQGGLMHWQKDTAKTFLPIERTRYCALSRIANGKAPNWLDRTLCRS